MNLPKGGSLESVHFLSSIPPDDEKNNSKPDKRPPLFHYKSKRFHILLYLTIGHICTSMTKLNLGIAMTCMVNSTAIAMTDINSTFDGNSSFHKIVTVNEGSENSDSCSSALNSDALPIYDYGGTFLWSPKIQGTIFSGMFYGTLIMILPSGYIVDTGSPKRVLLIIFGIIGSLAALIPTAASFGWFPVFVLKLIQGAADAFALPAMYKLMSSWIPQQEKSVAATLATTGYSVAFITVVPLFGFLCSSSLRWPAIFYVSAVFALLYTLSGFFIIESTPEKCKIMTEKERVYLTSKPELVKHKKKNFKLPIKKLFTSLPLLANIICAISTHFMAAFSQYYIPTFYKEVLLLSPIKNGIFTALPSALELIFKLSWGIMLDTLKKKQLLSNTRACKISQAVGGFSQAVLFVVIAYTAHCTRKIVVLILFCVLNLCSSTITTGFITSAISIAPAFTATIISLMGTIGTMTRLTVPVIVSYFVQTGTIEEWRPVFFIMAGLAAFSASFFLIFGSGEVQSWGNVKETTDNAVIALKLLKANDNDKTEAVNNELAVSIPATDKV